jgi:hypothetical protein
MALGDNVEDIEPAREVPTEVTASVATELADWSSGVDGLFVHGNRGHTSQVLQPPVDQSASSVATEAGMLVDGFLKKGI